MDEFMEQGPGLRITTRHWVLARDRTKGKSLLGGLGGMGVGQMWFDDNDSIRADPTYADAPDGTSYDLMDLLRPGGDTL